MKMNPMDFMETLGEVRETYVEEVLDAKEGRGMVRQRQRWSLLPAFGILCGAAVCAVMVFGIWSVKHPEAMRRTPAADSAASSAEQDAMASEAERSSTEIVPAAQTEIITEIGTALKEDGETGTGEKGIIAEIKTGTLTETGCTLILTNISDTTLCFGNCWEVADAATGKALTPNQVMVWNDLAWELDSGASQEITINWQPYYSELPNGSYLLRFGDAGIWDISVPFEITGGQTAQTATTTVTAVTGTDTTPVATTTVTTVTAVTSAAAQPKENTENTGSSAVVAPETKDEAKLFTASLTDDFTADKLFLTFKMDFAARWEIEKEIAPKLIEAFGSDRLNAFQYLLSVYIDSNPDHYRMMYVAELDLNDADKAAAYEIAVKLYETGYFYSVEMNQVGIPADADAETIGTALAVFLKEQGYTAFVVVESYEDSVSVCFDQLSVSELMNETVIRQQQIEAVKNYCAENDLDYSKVLVSWLG